jgi:hypothetical protein
MNRNEKFVYFLESLITDENQSLIEAIYEGFGIITEANRYERELEKKDKAAGFNSTDREYAKITGRYNIANAKHGKGSNMDMLEKRLNRSFDRGDINAENAADDDINVLSHSPGYRNTVPDRIFPGSKNKETSFIKTRKVDSFDQKKAAAMGRRVDPKSGITR